MTESAQFSSLVQSFFAQHLCEHKHVSPRTVTVYRDTFRLLFAFMQERTGRAAQRTGHYGSGCTSDSGVPRPSGNRTATITPGHGTYG